MAKATTKYGDKPVTGVILELAKHEAEHLIYVLERDRGKWHEPYFASAIRDQLHKALRPVKTFSAASINSTFDDILMRGK